MRRGRHLQESSETGCVHVSTATHTESSSLVERWTRFGMHPWSSEIKGEIVVASPSAAFVWNHTERPPLAGSARIAQARVLLTPWRVATFARAASASVGS